MVVQSLDNVQYQVMSNMPDRPQGLSSAHTRVTKLTLPLVFTAGVTRPRDDRRDRELLSDLASGRREAIGLLYDRHAAALFRHGLALTRRHAEAEDLVQAVFVKLATTGAELLGVRSPASYLHRMLKTTWVDAQRRAIVGERVVEQGTTSGPAPVADLDVRLDIDRALGELPPLQREVVVLHLVEGYSFLEVGRMTGVSLFTAAGRYRLGVARLRKMLDRSGGPS
jgi:RNA polymerase sigma-70 factor (ECF subfamily)